MSKVIEDLDQLFESLTHVHSVVAFFQALDSDEKGVESIQKVADTISHLHSLAIVLGVQVNREDALESITRVMRSVKHLHTVLAVKKAYADGDTERKLSESETRTIRELFGSLPDEQKDKFIQFIEWLMSPEPKSEEE